MEAPGPRYGARSDARGQRLDAHHRAASPRRRCRARNGAVLADRPAEWQSTGSVLAATDHSYLADAIAAEIRRRGERTRQPRRRLADEPSTAAPRRGGATEVLVAAAQRAVARGAGYSLVLVVRGENGAPVGQQVACWPGRPIYSVEEPAVTLVPDGGSAGASLLDRRVVLVPGVGLVDDAFAVLRGGEVDRRRTADIAALEAERVVVDLLAPALSVPANVEAHVRWDRFARRAGDCVDDVVVVLDSDVVGAEAGRSAGEVEADRGSWDRDRPEQARTGDARLEVVSLMLGVTDRAPVEQVNSDEAERAPPQSAIQGDVGARKESHVRVEVPLAAVAPARPAADLRSRDYSLEVADR